MFGSVVYYTAIYFEIMHARATVQVRIHNGKNWGANEVETSGTIIDLKTVSKSPCTGLQLLSLPYQRSVTPWHN